MANSLHHLATNINRFRLGVALGFAGVCLTLLPTLTSAAVFVSRFKVQLQSNQVQLIWKTEYENLNSGFNILRSTSAGGPYAQIKVLCKGEELTHIPPSFSSAGAEYTCIDTTITSGQTYYYKLRAISSNSGGTQEFGPQSTSLGNPAPTATNTPVQSAAKTNTPPAPTATRTNTPAPTVAGATPTRTATSAPTSVAQTKPASPPLSPTKVAVAVVPAQPTKPPASAPQVPPPSSTDNNVDSAPVVTPEPESTEDVSMAGDNSVAEESSTIDEQVVTDDPTNWTRILLSASFFGLAGLLGLGGLVLSAATIYFLLSPSKR